MKTLSKQILRILSATIKVAGVSITSGNSSKDVTSALTTVLTTAGDNNTSIPLQISSGSASPGVIVTSGINRNELFDNTTKEKLSSVAGNEIYGRLTFATSVYTLSFYYLDGAGAEQPYTFTSNTTIDFDFNYRYEFHQLPADALVFQMSRNISSDPKVSGILPKTEVLTVTATNTLSAISIAPNLSNPVYLSVNGQQIDRLGGSPAFTVSGVTVTWNQTNAGWPLETTDRVVIAYYL